MTRTALAAFAAATFALAGAVPAQAQDYRFDIGINGGASWYSDALEVDELFLDDIDQFDGLVVNELSGDGKFDNGWLTGAQATWWPARLFGIRANFAYTDRPFDFDGDFGDVVGFDGLDIEEIILGGRDELIESVNLWSGTGDVMVRFLGPRRRRFLGIRMLPYVALGAGAKWVNPTGHRDFLVVEDEDDLDNVDEEDGTIFQIGDELFALDKATKFMGLIGLGSDIRLARHWALRAEVGDRIWEAPIDRLEPTLLDDVFFREEVGETVHEIYATLGVHALLGVERPERRPVAVAPAPPAAPPVEEERVTVCVIGPNVDDWIGTVDAIYVPSTNDTLVVDNGDRVDIETAVGDVMVVSETSWFSRGEPMTITVDDATAEYVTFGGGRIVEADDLAFLGTVNGLPVYADEQEVQSINPALLQLGQGGGDLQQALAANEDLMADFDEIQVLYVPLQPTGCVFQPVRRVEEVRKIRG